MHPFNSAPQKALPGDQSTLPDLRTVTLPARFTSRKARIQDVNGMSSLINEFAAVRIMLARGPLYLYQNIQDYRVITAMAGDREVVLACGGLHVLWEDLAEVRSVAVHPELQRRGIGRELINYAANLCREDESYTELLVGTGETPGNLTFYKKCGFEYSHRIKDFFKDNYDHVIIEDGTELRDMIYLKMKL